MVKKDMTLISLKEMKQRYGIGRYIGALLLEALPHVDIGRKTFVFAGDVEEFLLRAAEQGLNLSKYLKELIRQKKAAASGGDK